MKKKLLPCFFLLCTTTIFSQSLSDIGDFIIHNLIPEKFEVNEKYLGDVKMEFPNGINLNSALNGQSIVRFNLDLDGTRKDFDVYFKLLGDGKLNINYGSFAEFFKTKGDIDLEMELNTDIVKAKAKEWMSKGKNLYYQGKDWAASYWDSYWNAPEKKTEKEKTTEALKKRGIY